MYSLASRRSAGQSMRAVEPGATGAQAGLEDRRRHVPMIIAEPREALAVGVIPERHGCQNDVGSAANERLD
jgi:hypothetical protein